MFPGTMNDWRKKTPLAKDVTNCRRNAMPKILEVLLLVFTFFSVI
jgi:hypothetical protein